MSTPLLDLLCLKKLYFCDVLVCENSKRTYHVSFWPTNCITDMTQVPYILSAQNNNPTSYLAHLNTNATLRYT